MSDAPPRFRIFISSPSDVAAERARALRVIARLNGEYQDHLLLEAVAWEERTYAARDDFQSQIDQARHCDLVLGIVWARAGFPLDPKRYRRPGGGRAFESGTVYEIETALERSRAEGIPDVALFRKTARMQLDLDGNNKADVAQLDLLKSVLDRWLRTSDGHFRGAFNSFNNADEFEVMVEQHLRSWLADRGHAGMGRVWRIDRDGSPYPGLFPYEASHASVFFGRAEARERCREKLTDAAASGCAFLLILGASGSGKSSLARSGLIPRIALPGSVQGVDDWRAAVFRPGHAPVDALARALFSAIPELAQGDSPTPEELAATVAARPAAAAAAVVAALARARSGPARVVVLADQLEEAFDVPAADRAVCFAALDALARSGVVWVIATLRSDRYAAFQAEPVLLTLKDLGAAFDLAPPDPVEIVHGPARAAGLVFEQDPRRGDLADVLLRDAQGHDTLPLLQMALSQLFERRDENAGRLTFAAYDAIGGLKGAVARHAETVLSGASAAARAELPALLLALAGGVTDARAITGRTSRADNFHEGRPEREELLRVLIAGRLLVADQPMGNTGLEAPVWIHPAHDALLNAWPRAEIVLNRDFVALKTRLEIHEREWRALNRRRRYLLRGPALDAALQLRQAQGRALPTGLVVYITRSRRAHRWRQMRAFAAMFGIFLLVMSVGAVIEHTEQERKKAVNAANGIARYAFRYLGEIASQQSGTHNKMGDALAEKGDLEGALREYKASLEMDKEVQIVSFKDPEDEKDDETTALEKAKQQKAHEWQAQINLGHSYDTVAASLKNRGAWMLALEQYQAGLAVRLEMLRVEPNDGPLQNDILINYANIGNILVDQNEFRNALEAYRAGLAIASRLAAEYPSNADWQRNLWVSLVDLADGLRQIGSRDEARETARSALAQVRSNLKRFPNEASSKEDLKASENLLQNIDRPEAGSQEDLIANVGDRVMFDVGQFNLGPEARTILERQAAWLNLHDEVEVTIYGYADEREDHQGGGEFALDISQRRAGAARDYLVAKGVKSTRVTATGYGETQPVAPSADVANWFRNRTAVTVVQ